MAELVVFIIAVIILWRILAPRTPNSTQESSFASGNSSDTKRRYKTDRPSGIYYGPETWQLKDIKRNIFLYAAESGKVSVQGLPFAVLDFETTGLEPYHRHRPIEVSVVLFSQNGEHEESFTTLINPGIPIDNCIYHGITDEDVKEAPSMETVLPYILHLLSGRIVVTHNAPFEEVFLFHAAQRAGLPLNIFCSVDTLSLSRICLDIPNHKLGTICEYLGIDLSYAHAAEADALATGHLYINLLKRRSLYVPQLPPSQISASPSRPKISVRRPKVSKGTEGYMNNLLRLLPASSVPIDSQAEAAYVDMLTSALADKRLLKEEASSIAKLAIDTGISASRAKELNRFVLDSALQLAMEDSKLEQEELRNLKTMAKLVGFEGYFDNMKANKQPRSTKQES